MDAVGLGSREQGTRDGVLSGKMKAFLSSPSPYRPVPPSDATQRPQRLQEMGWGDYRELGPRDGAFNWPPMVNIDALIMGFIAPLIAIYDATAVFSDFPSPELVLDAHREAPNRTDLRKE